MRAEARDDVAESARKAVELAARHRTKERACQRTVVALELGDQLLAFPRSTDRNAALFGYTSQATPILVAFIALSAIEIPILPLLLPINVS